MIVFDFERRQISAFSAVKTFAVHSNYLQLHKKNSLQSRVKLYKGSISHCCSNLKDVLKVLQAILLCLDYSKESKNVFLG